MLSFSWVRDELVSQSGCWRLRDPMVTFYQFRRSFLPIPAEFSCFLQEASVGLFWLVAEPKPACR